MSPYTQEISRERKGFIFFLLDQSYSMEEPLGGKPQRKCDELAKVINAWLQNLIIRCSKPEVRDYFDIGMLGYRTDKDNHPIIESPFQGDLAGQTLVKITDIYAQPAREDDVIQQLPDEETGEILEMPSKMPVWIDPIAEGGTPMCRALYDTFELVEKWIDEHPKSFPPIVVNITDGESQDGDPVPYADSLKELSTEDGNVLLFNCHLSMTASDWFLFPSSNEILPDELARVLFEMSSVLPETMYKVAITEGFELQPNARGMAFNADMVALIKFIDMGTRAPLR